MTKKHCILVFVTMSLCGMGLLLAPPFWQALASILLIGFVGLPHGGLDAYQMWSNSGRMPYPFARQVARYLLVAFLALAAWWFLPLAFWSIFLAISVYHFGVAKDLFPVNIPKFAICKWVSFFSKGLLIVFVPAVSYAESVKDILGVASSPAFAEGFVDIAPALVFLAIGAALTVAAFELTNPLGKDFALSVLLQSTVLVLLFSLVPPLVSFTLYFVFIHSIPQMLETRTSFPQISARTLLGVGTAFSLPPLALLTLVLSQEISWNAWASQGSSYIFVVLAVLHFPHFWLLASE